MVRGPGRLPACKPEPGLLLVAADRLQVEPARCLVVGDSDAHDGEAARRAGMRYLQVGLMDVVERVDAELSRVTSMLPPPTTPLEFADATARLPEH